MSFLKTYPISILILSLVIVGLFGAASESLGFWDMYGYDVPDNEIDSTFNKVNEMNKEAENLVCDINPERETCTEREGQLTSEELTFVQKMIKGSYGGLITFIKLFGLPKQLLVDIMTDLNVPPIFQTTIYTMLLFTIIITIIIFLFTRSDTA